MKAAAVTHKAPGVAITRLMLPTQRGTTTSAMNGDTAIESAAVSII